MWDIFPALFSIAEESGHGFTSLPVDEALLKAKITRSEQAFLSNDKTQDKTLSYLGMLNKSYDFMQDRMCEQTIEIHKPDIVVNIPRTIGTTLEFYRAQEIVEEGRVAARKAIANWKLKQVI